MRQRRIRPIQQRLLFRQQEVQRLKSVLCIPFSFLICLSLFCHICKSDVLTFCLNNSHCFCHSFTYLKSLLPGFSSALITMVFAALLSNLCLFSFVNIQPRSTSSTRIKDLPKLEIAMVFTSAGLPSRSVVRICKSILPMDWPLCFDSMYVQ